MNRHGKHALAGCVSLIVGAYAIYATSFFAWITATPATAEQIEQARKYANRWSVVVVICLVAFVANAVVWYRKRHEVG